MSGKYESKLTKTKTKQVYQICRQAFCQSSDAHLARRAETLTLFHAAIVEGGLSPCLHR